MTKNKVLFVIITLSLILGFTVGVGFAESTPLEVGVIAPLEGTWQTVGLNSIAALEVAREAITHYDSNLHIQMTVLNSRGQPEKALEKMKRLRDSGVKLVIGPMTSAEVMHVESFALENNMLIISPTATASKLSDYPHIFRVAPKDMYQSELLTRAMDEKGIEELLVIHIDDIYGHNFYEDLLLSTEKHGISLLHPVTLDREYPQYSRAIGEIKDVLKRKERTSTAVLLLDSDTRALELIQAIPDDSRLSQFKWYVGESIAGSSLLLEDYQASRFAVATEMEGFLVDNRAPMFNAPVPLFEYVMKERLEVPFHVSSAFSWDALWLLARTHRRATETETTFTEGLIEESWNFTNAFHFTNPFNEHGDTLSALFSRFCFVEMETGFDWDFRGLYLRSAHHEEWSSLHEPFPTYGHDKGVLSIGALLPLTGDLSNVGQEAKDILESAVEVANDFLRKTVPGVTVDLIIRNTKTKTQETKDVVEDLYSQNITTFVGPYSSAELAALQDLSQDKSMIFVSPSSTAPSLAGMDMVLRLAITDAVQVQAWRSYLVEEDISQLIVLYREDIYGQEIAALFVEMFGGTVELVSYDPTDLNASNIVQELEEVIPSEKGNSAVLAASFEEISQILKEVPLESSLLEISWFGTDGTAQLSAMVDYEEVALRASMVNFTATSFSHFGKRFSSYKPILDLVMDANISTFGFNTYDAFWFLVEAAIESGIRASVEETWNQLTKQERMLGLGGYHYFSEDWDRRTGNFLFHEVVEEEGIYVWKEIGVYENTREAQDSLTLYY